MILDTGLNLIGLVISPSVTCLMFFFAFCAGHFLHLWLSIWLMTMTFVGFWGDDEVVPSATYLNLFLHRSPCQQTWEVLLQQNIDAVRHVHNSTGICLRWQVQTLGKWNQKQKEKKERNNSSFKRREIAIELQKFWVEFLQILVSQLPTRLAGMQCQVLVSSGRNGRNKQKWLACHFSLLFSNSKVK